MSPHGNYLLARAVFPRVVDLLPQAVGRSTAVAQAPSEEESEQLLAFTPINRRRVAQFVLASLGQAPFTNQLTHGEQVRALQREIESGIDDPRQTAAAYRWALARAPADRWLHFNYGVLLEGASPRLPQPSSVWRSSSCPAIMRLARSWPTRSS